MNREKINISNTGYDNGSEGFICKVCGKFVKIDDIQKLDNM